MILCSKLKNGLCKIVTKSQVVTKFNVTKSRLHCIYHQTRFYQNVSMCSSCPGWPAQNVFCNDDWRRWGQRIRVWWWFYSCHGNRSAQSWGRHVFLYRWVIFKTFLNKLNFLKNLVSSLKKIHKNLQKFVRMAKNPSFFSEKKTLHV